jgi:hypothetical protein
MNGKLTRRRTTLIFAGVAVITAGTVGGAAALAGDDDDARDRPIPASVLGQAEQAALDELGAGTVTETEVDDEESKYEVEVTLPDGTQVDVQLDEDFHVVGTEHENTDDESGKADD